RGRAADHPLRRPRRRRRGLRARDGRAREDHRAGREHDPALRPGARRGHRDRHRRPPPRREASRGTVQPRRASASHSGREDRGRLAAAARPAVGRAGVLTGRGARVPRQAGRAGEDCVLARARARSRAAVERPALRLRYERVMHLVQEIGSYAGFAAVVGLAVLSALYFSQARDVKRLREWAGRAPERAAEEEARIAAQTQAAQTQAAQQRAAAAGGATVAAPAVRPQGSAAAAATPPPSGVPTPPPPTLPSARPAAGTTAASMPILSGMRPDEPWYRRIHWPAPRYIALIVVGILVLGAGAAYGVSQLT